MCFCASEVSARGNAGVSAAMESGTNGFVIIPSYFIIVVSLWQAYIYIYINML